MPTIANASVVGHLYGPVELKKNDKGSWALVRFWTNDKLKGEEEKKFTSWGGLVSGPQAEWLARDAKKGSLIFVSGSIRLGSFKKQDGTESHSIEFTRIADARLLEREDKPESADPQPQTAAHQPTQRSAPRVNVNMGGSKAPMPPGDEPPFAPRGEWD